jgi:signal transduction histidine kinase
LILYDRGDFDSALVYFEEAVELLLPLPADSSGVQYNLSSVYNNMALTYSDLDDLDMSLNYLRKGLTLARKIDDLYYIGSVYLNLGSVFGQLGRNDSALYYLHRSLKIARDMGFRQLELEGYDELAQYHAGYGNYASAYNWLLRYDTVYKEVFNEKQSEQIARLQSRYKQELTDREIEQLHSESQVQRMLNFVFVAFIVIIIALGVIIVVNLRSKLRANRTVAQRNDEISNALEQLSKSEEELQKLNRSKDRIFTVVAHDLRNPVAAVTGFSELLYENFEEFPVETQKEYLLQIVQGTQRIQNLLENLLVWARSQMQAIKYEPADLSVKELIDDCLRELKANLDHKKVRCTLTIEEDCNILADKDMLHTVCRNLLMNAIKFSFPGGRIWISSKTTKDHCEITFSDEGIGIQPEIQEKLFDANETFSTPGTSGESGSGLGLAICKDFLEKNKGSILVESTPGNGSSFIISLPKRKA